VTAVAGTSRRMRRGRSVLWWAAVAVVVALGVLLPAERASAGDGQPPAGSRCEFPNDESVESVRRYQECLRNGGPTGESGDSAGCEVPGDDATEQERQEYQDCVLQGGPNGRAPGAVDPDCPETTTSGQATSSGLQCVRCVFGPTGDTYIEDSSTPTNGWTEAFDWMTEELGLRRGDVTVALTGGEPGWYVDELIGNRECDLADSRPTSCGVVGITGTSDDLSRETDGVWRGPTEHGERPSTDAQGILPDECVGLFPSSHYDFMYSSQGFLNVEDRFLGNLSTIFFGMGKTALQVGFKATRLAYDFTLWDRLSGQQEAAWVDFEQEVLGPLELGQLVWLIFVGYLALLMARGSLSLAANELVVSVLLLGLFTVLMFDAQGHMTNISRSMDDISASVLRIGCGDRDGNGYNDSFEDDRRLDRTLQRDQADAGMVRMIDPCEDSGLRARHWRLHMLFVDEPYRYINWNWDDEFREQCASKMGDILSVGPHGTDDWPRNYLKRGQQPGQRCYDAAVWNEDATVERMFQSLMAGIMGVGVTVVLAMMALSILIAKVVVALLFLLLPLPAALAVLPGQSRRLATSWVTTLVQAVLVAIAMSVLLSLLMILLEAFASVPGDTGLSLTERWIALLVILALVSMARKRFLAALQGVAARVNDRLANPGLLAGGFGGGGGGLGGGGGGGGFTQSTAPSLFATPRATPELQTGFNVASAGMITGVTAAATVASLGLNLARIPISATKPYRDWRRAQRAANRTNEQNVIQDGIKQFLARRSAHGTKRGLLAQFPQVFENQQAILPPRWQRRGWQNYVRHARRRMRAEKYGKWAVVGNLASDSVGWVPRLLSRIPAPDPNQFPAPEFAVTGHQRAKQKTYKAMTSMSLSSYEDAVSVAEYEKVRKNWRRRNIGTPSPGWSMHSGRHLTKAQRAKGLVPPNLRWQATRPVGPAASRLERVMTRLAGPLRTGRAKPGGAGGQPGGPVPGPGGPGEWPDGPSPKSGERGGRPFRPTPRRRPPHGGWRRPEGPERPSDAPGPGSAASRGGRADGERREGSGWSGRPRPREEGGRDRGPGPSDSDRRRGSVWFGRQRPPEAGGRDRDPGPPDSGRQRPDGATEMRPPPFGEARPLEPPVPEYQPPPEIDLESGSGLPEPFPEYQPPPEIDLESGSGRRRGGDPRRGEPRDQGPGRPREARPDNRVWPPGEGDGGASDPGRPQGPEAPDTGSPEGGRGSGRPRRDAPRSGRQEGREEPRGPGRSRRPEDPGRGDEQFPDDPTER
jgi:hypothetical protein